MAFLLREAIRDLDALSLRATLFAMKARPIAELLSRGCRAVLLTSLMALCACDPGFRFGGVVTDGAGHPIKDAEARLRCEGSYSRATTDAEGRFLQTGMGRQPSSCIVEVAAPGRPLWSEPVMNSCRSRSLFWDGCYLVEAQVKLADSTDPATPPNKPAPRMGCLDPSRNGRRPC